MNSCTSMTANVVNNAEQKPDESALYAEKALVGAILQWPDEVYAICISERITAQSFTDCRTRNLFSAAHSLLDGGNPADMLTVYTVAGMIDEISSCGDFISLASTAAHAAFFARRLKDEERRRALVEAMELALAAAKRTDGVISGITDILRDSIEAADKDRAGPRILSAREFCGEDIQEPPQIIRGVIRAGQIGIMAASSKVGKSWALLALCLAVSTGRKWFDWETTVGRVLYINAELPEYDLQRRLKILCQIMGLEAVPDTLDVWHMRGESRTFKALIPDIMRKQRQAGPFGLIVPDPIYCFGDGRDENDNAEQALTMSELSQVAERTGAAVMAAHHFSKGNQSEKDHLDRASGAGMFARAVDTFITLTRHEEEACYIVESTTRSFARPESFVIRWEYPVWMVDPNLDPEKLKKRQGGSAGAKYTIEKIVALLPLGGCGWTKWFLIAQEKLGMSKDTFSRLVRDSVRIGDVEKRGDIYVAKLVEE